MNKSRLRVAELLYLLVVLTPHHTTRKVLYSYANTLQRESGKKIKIYHVPVSSTADVLVSVGVLCISPFSSFELISVTMTERIITIFISIYIYILL